MHRAARTADKNACPGDVASSARRPGKLQRRHLTVVTTQEVSDAVSESGMEHGAAETYDRLADLLPSLS